MTQYRTTAAIIMMMLMWLALSSAVQARALPEFTELVRCSGQYKHQKQVK